MRFMDVDARRTACIALVKVEHGYCRRRKSDKHTNILSLVIGAEVDDAYKMKTSNDTRKMTELVIELSVAAAAPVFLSIPSSN